MIVNLVQKVELAIEQAKTPTDKAWAALAVMQAHNRAHPHPEQPQEEEWEAIEARAWDWLQETFGAVKPAVELDYAPHQMVEAFHAGHAAHSPMSELQRMGEGECPRCEKADRLAQAVKPIILEMRDVYVGQAGYRTPGQIADAAWFTGQPSPGATIPAAPSSESKL